MMTREDALLARIAELEAELAEWRAYDAQEWRERDDVDLLHRLKKRLGLRPTPARIALMLYEANGQPVHSEKLRINRLKPGKNMPDDTRMSEDKNVSVAIVHTRRVLGSSAIETVWGYGYKMSPLGLEKMKGALGDER